MAYNELRKDYLLNRWVVIATERGRRPTDFAKPRNEPAKNNNCPMCVGNEHVTPPASLLYLKENGEITRSVDPTEGERPKNWLIRGFPNLYPAFVPPKTLQDEAEAEVLGNISCGYAIGEHEVLAESPLHNDGPAEAELPQLELLIKAYIDRLSIFSVKPYVKYVQIFRNYGPEAGASLSHPHSQIIATPIIPPIIEEEQTASKAYFEANKTCFFCDLYEKEAKGPRAILENEHFLVFTPYASIAPMAFWIMPKRHSPNILKLSETEISAFAKTLKSSLKALKNLVNDPPYNYGFHLAIIGDAKDSYHWHLEVYPKLSIWAGFELSTGIFINTVTPENAASELKRVIEA
ncbi:MAG: galactose-1-phosphate uridylyltransferase [Candidatus Bathyarchaeia archaeon]|jgi:UDPglucose--hexose-1-phosphate uridylyltransferase